MLKNTIILIFIISFAFFSCNKKKEILTKNVSESKFIAYYFHPTARCESCINLESYMKEIIDTKYSKDGIKFIALNIEDAENEHYKKDFDLKYSSVILVKSDGEKYNKWKNLDSVWSYTDDKEKFIKYAEKEIINFIKE
jgi:hypothetical protein